MVKILNKHPSPSKKNRLYTPLLNILADYTEFVNKASWGVFGEGGEGILNWAKNVQMNKFNSFLESSFKPRYRL